MPKSNQNHETILNDHFTPDDLSYVTGLYNEGLKQNGGEQQQQHLAEVAELVGDFAVYQALGEKVHSDREIAREHAETFKATRAAEGARKIETQGFAEIAPFFKEQLKDDSRTNTFKFNRLPVWVDPEGWSQDQMTEAEGLRELADFLSDYKVRSNNLPGNSLSQTRAGSMYENLTFIGEKEYSEAVRGLGMTWKNYLQADPKRKICALASISDSKKYPGQRKSDDYLRDKILQTFSDEELEAYSGRIVGSLDDIQNDSPEDVKVVLIDDWTITGQQMRRVYDELKYDPYFMPYKNSLEVNCIVASEERIASGLQIDPYDNTAGSVSVKSYYKSHHVENTNTENKGYVSGLHSSVNYDFRDILEDMAYEDTNEGQMPHILALASILRSYRTEKPVVQISGEALRRVGKDGN